MLHRSSAQNKVNIKQNNKNRIKGQGQALKNIRMMLFAFQHAHPLSIKMTNENLKK